MGLEQNLGVGVDICDVSRIKSDIENLDTFVIDNFTDPEIVYCEQANNPQVRAQRYAARFAAKEAIIKALGGIDEAPDFREIYILKGRSGRPFVHLEGRAKQQADAIGVSRIHLSLAHLKDLAIAYCAVS